MREINQEIKRTKEARFKDIFAAPKNARPPKFSLEEAKQIRWLYEHGDYSIRKLARKFRCAAQTIDNVILGRGAYYHFGEKKPRKQRPPFTDQEKERIKRLEWEDYPLSAIAQEMKCSIFTVKKVLREFDVD